MIVVTIQSPNHLMIKGSYILSCAAAYMLQDTFNTFAILGPFLLVLVFQTALVRMISYSGNFAIIQTPQFLMHGAAKFVRKPAS